MQYEFKDPNDVKLFILCLLSGIKRPIEFNMLGDVCVQDGLMNPIAFSECVGELTDTGNILQREENGETVVEITEQGERVAASLGSKISGYIRTKSLQNALRFLSFKERGVRYGVSILPRKDGKFDLAFTFIEKEDVLLDVHLIADNEYQAKQMSIHFQEDPEHVFRSFLAILSGDAGYLKN